MFTDKNSGYHPEEGENLASILSHQFDFYQKYANDIIYDLEQRRGMTDPSKHMKNAAVGNDSDYEDPNQTSTSKRRSKLSETDNDPTINYEQLKANEEREMKATNETLEKQKQKIEDLKNLIVKMRDELSYDQYEQQKDDRPKVPIGSYRI